MRKQTGVIFGVIVAAVAFFAVIGYSIQHSMRTVTVDRHLEFLHVVMRHGMRTPVSTYPNDPHINATFHPIGWGQLTNPGKLDLYETGQYLRARYNNFLGTHYSPNEYYTQSTDVDRTKASVQLVNAGLWPPDTHQKWGPLDWQPIPVHAEQLADDQLLLVRRACAQYDLSLDAVLESDEIQEKLREHAQLFSELTALTGKTVRNFYDVEDVYNTLKAEESFNLTLPAWTAAYYPDRMLPLTEFSYVLNVYNRKLARLKGGRLVKQLIDDWKRKITGTIEPIERRAVLYGGHDSTVVNLMQALQVWDQQMPGYGITVMLELSRDLTSEQYGVEVYLRNSTEMPPYLLTIPGCESFCPFDRLLELTEDVVPGDDWDLECGTDDPTYQTRPPQRP